MANLRNLVKKCMDSTQYCSLATTSRTGVSVCPVVFSYDSDFDLYFVSSPKSEHMKNILKDSRVAVAVYRTYQKLKSEKIGMQLKGKATLLKKGAEIETAYKVYFDRIPEWADTDVSYFKDKSCEWPFIRIERKMLYYFNNGLFGEEKQKVK